MKTSVFVICADAIIYLLLYNFMTVPLILAIKLPSYQVQILRLPVFFGKQVYI